MILLAVNVVPALATYRVSPRFNATTAVQPAITLNKVQSDISRFMITGYSHNHKQAIASTNL